VRVFPSVACRGAAITSIIARIKVELGFTETIASEVDRDVLLSSCPGIDCKALAHLPSIVEELLTNQWQLFQHRWLLKSFSAVGDLPAAAP
jgi:hypothetical protein